jgi:hypothetical protein
VQQGGLHQSDVLQLQEGILPFEQSVSKSSKEPTKTEMVKHAANYAIALHTIKSNLISRYIIRLGHVHKIYELKEDETARIIWATLMNESLEALSEYGPYKYASKVLKGVWDIHASIKETTQHNRVTMAEANQFADLEREMSTLEERINTWYEEVISDPEELRNLYDEPCPLPRTEPLERATDLPPE